jgi:hypothetical protein
MTDDEIFAAGVEYARISRAEQGLPEHVTDPATIEKLAALLCSGDGDG